MIHLNYNPQIELITIDSIFVLSEVDTTFLEINLFASDQNGLDDIDSVKYYYKLEDFYSGTPDFTTLSCEYTILNDEGYSVTDSPYLFNSNCYGDFDENFEKVCEELSSEECAFSDYCTVNDNHAFYYTFQRLSPLGYPHCGGFGKVKFQFIVIDQVGLEDVSEEIIVEITP